MKRALIFLTVLLLALAVGRGVLAAQQAKGTSTLSGVVIGPDDKPAPHADISYQFSDGSGPHAARADAHGRFTISHLRPSSYDIRASAGGVFSDWARNLPLRKGQTRSVELRLIYAKEMPKSALGKKPKP
ncbi:MAG: carboxypeptidase-like regulatory domain-containing protein [Candidatus Acidiferrales bacterium]